VSFEQATIKVEKEAPFAELKASIEKVLASGRVEKFLKRIEGQGVRIRDFDVVLTRQALEFVDGGLQKAGKTAKGLYQELTVSDQAQMREFYLSRIEKVEEALRHKFRKVYQYY
jgi:hypothetical protein